MIDGFHPSDYVIMKSSRMRVFFNKKLLNADLKRKFLLMQTLSNDTESCLISLISHFVFKPCRLPG